MHKLFLDPKFGKYFNKICSTMYIHIDDTLCLMDTMSFDSFKYTQEFNDFVLYNEEVKIIFINSYIPETHLILIENYGVQYVGNLYNMLEVVDETKYSNFLLTYSDYIIECS